VITTCEFGQSGPGAGEDSLTGRRAELAERLAAAQRILAASSVDNYVRMRFQRRLTAVCDALKAPGADVERCARRLDLLLADLPPDVEAGPDGGS
jgi:hypothetical protein